MESALRPRDIQARIRAGESVEDVARAAGVPVERIDAFAAPVVAEREHVAGLARSNPVRRQGESASNRALRTATAEQLLARGIDPDDVTWDAWLLGARRWRVRAAFEHGGAGREALFVYDVAGRFSVAENDEARRLIGELDEQRPADGAQADDDLALVRALAESGESLEDADEVNDAYTEVALAEVDGVYDIVAGGDPQLDALYDMLAGFDEDSVKIYSGLVRPDAGAPVVADPAAPSAETPEIPEGARVEPLYLAEDVLAARPAEVEPQPEDQPQPEASPAPRTRRPRDPEQPSLMEGEPPAPRRKPRSKRATVPTWDEIMFGSPRQGPQKD